MYNANAAEEPLASSHCQEGSNKHFRGEGENIEKKITNLMF